MTYYQKVLLGFFFVMEFTSLHAAGPLGSCWPKDILQKILLKSSDIETQKKRCEQLLKAFFAALGSLAEKLTDSCFD